MEPEEQDMMHQVEEEGHGANREYPDQNEQHIDRDEEPVAVGPAKKMKAKTNCTEA